MYKAEGFAFETKEEAETAHNEAEAVRYIKQQTKMDDPETILKLYNSLLDKQLFKTEVGLRFLFELQDYLETIPFVKSEDIRPIPARKDTPVKGKKKKTKQEKTKQEKTKQEKTSGKTDRETKIYRRRSGIFLTTTIILLICVIGMFAITIISGNTTNILNYENQIINKYSSWEEELTDREQELNEREDRLESQEAELGK